MSKYAARAVSLKLGTEDCMGIEIPQEAIESMNLVDGEILSVEIKNGSLIMTRTGTIGNES